ncbi:MAG: hypothetical protein WCS77_08010 [Elusimicrobiaceae bacterium]
MGIRLKKGFELARQQGGLTLSMRLAMLTKMSGLTVDSMPDSPENIKTMTDALRSLGITPII